MYFIQTCRNCSLPDMDNNLQKNDISGEYFHTKKCIDQKTNYERTLIIVDDLINSKYRGVSFIVIENWGIFWESLDFLIDQYDNKDICKKEQLQIVDKCMCKEINARHYVTN